MEDKNKEVKSRRYLLGDLAEEDATPLEEDYFADDSAFEAAELAEDEIIDAYVRNELSPEDRKRFEERLLPSPRISQRIEFAKMLAARASSRRVPQRDGLAQPSPQESASDQKQADDPVDQISRWWNTGFWPSLTFRRLAFTSLTLVLIGAVVLDVDWLRIRDETKRLSASRAELEREKRDLIAENNKRSLETQELAEALKTKEAENAKLNEQLELALNKPSSPPPVISILLSIAGSRGGGTDQSVRLPEEPAILKIRIPLEEAKYERYFVTVKTTDDRVVSGPHQLKAHGKTLTLQLASTRFIPDDYIVTVSGLNSSGKAEEIEDYTLRVIRRSR